MQKIQEQVSKATETVKEQVGLGGKPLDVQKLKEMQECIKNDPSKAKLKYHVTSSIGNNYKVTNQISRFELGQESYQHSFNIIADLPAQLGGNDCGAAPDELLLSALGSCLCMSFLSVTKLENINITKCNVKLRGKIDLRSTFEEKGNVQRGFRAIVAKFDVQGENLKPERLHELIRRAQLLSPVAQSIEKTNKVFVCLKGEGKDIEQRYGLLGIGKEEIGEKHETAGEQQRESGVQGERKVHQGRQRGRQQGEEVNEPEHVEGYQELEGVKFLQPGVSVSPRREGQEAQQGQQQPQVPQQWQGRQHGKEGKESEIPSQEKESEGFPKLGGAQANLQGAQREQKPDIQKQKGKHEGFERVEGLGKQEKTTPKESPAQKPTLAQEQKPMEHAAKKGGEVEKRTGTEGVAPESKTR